MVVVFFFCKQKTAYELRISDWSSDVCSSDLYDMALRIVPAQIERLEVEIDAMNAALAPLTSFILPGGTEAAARLHLARAVARRAERAAVAAGDTRDLNPLALAYLNRLSDHLFVMGSEEPTPELQSLMRLSYAVTCLTKKI